MPKSMKRSLTKVKLSFSEDCLYWASTANMIDTSFFFFFLSLFKSMVDDTKYYETKIAFDLKGFNLVTIPIFL